jgi:hypothetical protein
LNIGNFTGKKYIRRMDEERRKGSENDGSQNPAGWAGKETGSRGG